MKILITLIIALSLNAEYIKEPQIVEFTPHKWKCTEQQLQKAHDKFKKCYKTPIFSECYGKFIMLECEKKWFK